MVVVCPASSIAGTTDVSVCGGPLYGTWSGGTTRMEYASDLSTAPLKTSSDRVPATPGSTLMCAVIVTASMTVLLSTNTSEPAMTACDSGLPKLVPVIVTRVVVPWPRILGSTFVIVGP